MILEGELGDKPCFGGKTFEYVDLSLISFYTRFYSIKTLGAFSIEAEFPKIVAQANRCMQKEIIAKTVLDQKKVYDCVRQFRSATYIYICSPKSRSATYIYIYIYQCGFGWLCNFVGYMLQCLRKAKIKTTRVSEFGYQSCPSFVHQYSFVWDATRMGILIYAFVCVKPKIDTINPFALSIRS